MHQTATERLHFLTIGELEQEAQNNRQDLFNSFAEYFLIYSQRILMLKRFTIDEAEWIGGDAMIRLYRQIRHGIDRRDSTDSGVRNKQMRASYYLLNECLPSARIDFLRKKEKDRQHITSANSAGEDQSLLPGSSFDDEEVLWDAQNNSYDSAGIAVMDLNEVGLDAFVDYRQPETVVLEKEEKRLLQGCIEHLPKHMGPTFILFARGFNGVEIAGILGVRPETISTQKSKALPLLKDCLERSGYSRQPYKENWITKKQPLSAINIIDE